ncbi:MAG: hemerythrin domain-containing protein [Anaerolineae bacterium]
MKRHPALQDLSRDHQLFLLQAQQIRWSVHSSRRAPPLGRMTTLFLEYWDRDADPHLREEEEVLLPIYARYSSQEQKRFVAQMMSDHTWLRARIGELRQRSPGQEVQELLTQIGQRLHDHVRFEERVVFQHVQEVMSEAELQEIGARSLAFRTKWRAPEAIGPHKGGQRD